MGNCDNGQAYFSGYLFVVFSFCGKKDRVDSVNKPVLCRGLEIVVKLLFLLLAKNYLCGWASVRF
jgi:hypothetical protein